MFPSPGRQRLKRVLLAVAVIATTVTVVARTPQPASAGPPPVLTTFVPLDEGSIAAALDSVAPASTPIGTDIQTTISVTVVADATIMYWDHWEDGFDPDIANAPASSTTETWGDNNPANGIPPGFAVDILDAGSIIVLDNGGALATPRNPAIQAFDGRDKVAASRGFALTRAGWETTYGTLHAGAVAATDLSRWGTRFEIPIGQKIASNKAFNYTGVSVMAADDTTVVQIDRDGNGTIDQEDVIGEGESVFVDGGINAGAEIITSKPVQVHLLTGDTTATFEDRWYEVFPVGLWSDEYVTPVGTTLASQPVTLFVYNRGPSSITVNVDAEGTANDTNLVISSHTTVSHNLPLNSGARLTSPGNPFYVVSATGAFQPGSPPAADSSSAHDCGYSLVPTSVLTPGVVVGWGPGNPSGTATFSPIWVAALGDTTLNIDYDNDGLVDATRALTAYESVTISDPDFDLTGARIFTDDGTLISVAWGQDPAGGECCDAYDLGTAVLPASYLVVNKTSDLVVDVNGDGLVNPGDTLEYTISAVDAGALSLTNVNIVDELPPELVYLPDSTFIDGILEPDDTNGTAFPLDIAGHDIPLIDPGETVLFTYRTEVIDPFPLFQQTIRNSVTIDTDQASGSATAVVNVDVPDLYVAKSSDAADDLMPGDGVVYTIDVANNAHRNRPASRSLTRSPLASLGSPPLSLDPSTTRVRAEPHSSMMASPPPPTPTTRPGGRVHGSRLTTPAVVPPAATCG